MATSTTKAEYVATASCYGEVLWIQNQMLDYGFNFINTKIYIDNESTICIVKNPVYHSKTKHIAISTTSKGMLMRRNYLDKQLANVPVPLDHFPVNALTSKVFSFMVKKGKHFSRKVTPLFAYMLVQPTQDEGVPSERPSKAQPIPSPTHPSEVHVVPQTDSSPTHPSEVPIVPQTDSSPTHPSEVPVEPQTDPSSRPSPSTIIPDSIPETSGGNLGGHSSSDKSLLGNEGEMTLQSIYDLCLSLCVQVSDQAKEIQHLKAQIKKLKKQAKLVIKHHRAWMQSVSLKQRLARKRSSKKQWVHKESVSKHERKFAKGEPSVHRDPLFDEIPEDTHYMETKNAQDVGRTSDIVGEEKEMIKMQIEGTDEQIEGTNEQRKDSDDHTEEGSLLSYELSKAVSERRSLLDLKASLKIDPKIQGRRKIKRRMNLKVNLMVFLKLKRSLNSFASDEDIWLGNSTRRVGREQFTIEERAKFLHDTIAAQRKFFAQQRSETIRNRPPTKNQLRNQMMTYLKPVGNFKHSDFENQN
ncbi:hypothetical protein Tco_0462167 [Tanacetum coccineum]